MIEATTSTVASYQSTTALLGFCPSLACAAETIGLRKPGRRDDVDSFMITTVPMSVYAGKSARPVPSERRKRLVDGSGRIRILIGKQDTRWLGRDVTWKTKQKAQSAISAGIEKSRMEGIRQLDRGA